MSFGTGTTAFGGGFGQPAATSTAAAPAFGTTFGAPAAAATAAPTAFGAPAAGQTSFTGFGGAAATSLGGGTAFGSTAPAAAGTTSFTGFGSAAASKPAGLSFGTTTTSSTAGGSAFGGFGAGTSTFGTGATGGLFTQQQQKPFGAATSLGGGLTFGQPQQQLQQQQQQQAQPQQQVEQLYNAVVHCSIFGDERDAILARWNMLQASWGVGRAFFSSSAPPLPLTADNPLCRFKTVSYSAMPTCKDEDGLISAIIKRKASDLSKEKDQIGLGIQQHVLGNKPNIKVVVNDIRPADAASSKVVFYVQESNPQTGQSRRVPASEIGAFLSQPMQVQNLQKLGFEQATPWTAYSSAEIKEYLNMPPKGIDPRLWKQAQLDNPDAKSMLPIPLISFKALQQRIASQDDQSRLHKSRLFVLSDVIEDLQKRQQETRAKLRDAKRRQLALAHRVLHVMVRQEETRKIGFTIQPEEERLRIHLEALQSEMSAPTQFKGRLNELLSQVRLQSQASALQAAAGAGGGGAGGGIDPFLQQDIKEALKQQQRGIQALITLMREDMDDLNLVAELTESESKTKHKNL